MSVTQVQYLLTQSSSSLHAEYILKARHSGCPLIFLGYKEMPPGGGWQKEPWWRFLVSSSEAAGELPDDHEGQHPVSLKVRERS